MDPTDGLLRAGETGLQLTWMDALPVRLLAGSQARSILDVVESKLLTPLGLRTHTPHTPRGCPFQAWSLGEFLRLKHQILQIPT